MVPMNPISPTEIREVGLRICYLSECSDSTVLERVLEQAKETQLYLIFKKYQVTTEEKPWVAVELSTEHIQDELDCIDIYKFAEIWAIPVQASNGAAV